MMPEFVKAMLNFCKDQGLRAMFCVYSFRIYSNPTDRRRDSSMK